jgi:iron complex transport system substrate-binding protein
MNKLSIIAILFFLGIAEVAVSDTREITDMTGRKVAIPAKIERIAVVWPAYAEILLSLGSGNKICATGMNVKMFEWMLKVCPTLGTARSVSVENELNIEELVKSNPDIVFLNNPKQVQKAEEAGLVAVNVGYSDFQGLMECIGLSGKILGDPYDKKAGKLIDYFSGKIKIIHDRFKEQPAKERPKILHLLQIDPLYVDGRNAIVDSWIETAGGVNTADFEGSAKPVSLEQIMSWNPDIIIIGKVDKFPVKNGLKMKEEISSLPGWSSLNAVKNKRVFLNPDGVFFWGRASAEESLQIQWAAKTFFPGKFKDIDIRKEIKFFYRTFFGYEITDEDLSEMLAD